VVVVGLFTAACLLNLVVLLALFLDKQWSLLGGVLDTAPAFSSAGDYAHLIPLVWGFLLQLAWWGFLIFCYICGMYDQVAEKYYDIKWFEMCMPFRFQIFPLGYVLFGFSILGLLFLLAVGGVRLWHFIF
jgi:hypothetical protein